jgi:hypothetical protein
VEGIPSAASVMWSAHVSTEKAGVEDRDSVSQKDWMTRSFVKVEQIYKDRILYYET